MKTTLVIIFNHRFDRNLPVLRELYEDKFDHLLFLVPFYDGPDPDVVPVIYGSHEFGGFVYNARDRLQALDCDFYVFAGDDLILRPDFDRDLGRSLGLQLGQGYIKRLVPMTTLSYTWAHTLTAMDALYKGAFNWHEFLPAREDFLQVYEKHGIHYPNFSVHSLKPVRKPRSRQEVKRWFRRAWLYFSKPERRCPPVPLLESYADFFIVPGEGLEKFCALNGYFAATKIHAELAIPTALAMSSPAVKTEKDSELNGIELWRPWERESVEKEFNKNLDRLLAEFPQRALYIHPVKLSGWKTERFS